MSTIVIEQPEVVEHPKADFVVIESVQKQHNDMQVINHDGQFVIDSRDVAEMVARNHADVIRDIRKIIYHLGGQSKIAESYFIGSNYANSQNKNTLATT